MYNCDYLKPLNYAPTTSHAQCHLQVTNRIPAEWPGLYSSSLLGKSQLYLWSPASRKLGIVLCWVCNYGNPERTLERKIPCIEGENVGTEGYRVSFIFRGAGHMEIWTFLPSSLEVGVILATRVITHCFCFVLFYHLRLARKC